MKLGVWYGICLMVLLAVSGISCSSNNIQTHYQPNGSGFTLILEPGSQYRAFTSWFIFKLPVYPQVAVWIESEDGTFIGTLYVTAKTARGSFVSAPKNGRPEALPVWSARREAKIDAVSMATASGSTNASLGVPPNLAPGVYSVYLETNRSYDYNARYTMENSGVSGQPSLVYRSVIDTTKAPLEETFTVVGIGSVDGSDGDIHQDLSGIDTALSLFSLLRIRYQK